MSGRLVAMIATVRFRFTEVDMTLIEVLGILHLVVLLVGFSAVTRAVKGLIAETERLESEVKELRLTSRTRIRTAKVRSGVADDETPLRRLGRASAAQRIVVGGDDDSQLNQSLNVGANRGRKVSDDA